MRAHMHICGLKSGWVIGGLCTERGPDDRVISIVAANARIIIWTSIET